MTVKEQIVELLSERQGWVSSKEIADVISENGVDRATVRGRLSEMKAAGVIEFRESDSSFRVTGGFSAEEKRIVFLEDRVLDLQKELKKGKRGQHFEDMVLEAITENCRSFDPAPPPLYKLPTSNKVSQESVVLMLSDWHLGEIVSPVETGGIGNYNPQIAARRLQFTVEYVIKFCQEHLRGGYYLPKIHVFLLGDFVSTNIHNLMQHCDFAEVDSWMCGAVLLSYVIRELAAHFESVEVTGVPGNHARLTEKKQFTKAYNNWDYLMYNAVATVLLGQSNVEFYLPKSFFALREIEGHKFFLVHGDDIRSWGKFPWYGLDKYVKGMKELMGLLGEEFQYFCCGHFHQELSMDEYDGEILICGSPQGATDFSIRALTKANKPKQLIFLVHPEHGVTIRDPIYLDKIPEDMEQRYRFDRNVPMDRQLRKMNGWSITPA